MGSEMCIRDSYMQGGVLYKCTRDTGNPVYHDLSALVGIYVELVGNTG